MLQAKQIEDKYAELVNKRAVVENSNIIIHLKFEKAQNDLFLANGLLQVSLKKTPTFGNRTFFDWIIV